MNHKRTVTSFTVDGPGRIPFDMLRYDGAFPAGSEDAAEIENRIYRSMGEIPRDTPRKPITLRTAHESAPTTARWESFNWRVVAIDGRPV